MTRALLLASLLTVALAIAGCTSPDESVDDGLGVDNDTNETGNSTNQPNETNDTLPDSSAMCLEGAENCDDTPATNGTTSR